MSITGDPLFIAAEQQYRLESLSVVPRVGHGAFSDGAEFEAPRPRSPWRLPWFGGAGRLSWLRVA